MNFTSPRRLLVATVALAAAGGTGVVVAQAANTPASGARSTASSPPAAPATAPVSAAAAAGPTPIPAGIAPAPAPTSPAMAGRLSAAAATLIAERQGRGRASKVEAESEVSGPTYQVKVIRPGGIEVDVVVDANTGRVLRTQVDTDDRVDAKDRPAGALSAAKATLIAERQGRGRASKVEAESEVSGPTYQVKVIRPGGIEVDIVVDANTGRVFRAHLDMED